MKYTGETCKRCGEVFAEGDDVVVCPQCGTPHHRQCYKEYGECVNAELHGEGFRWKSEKAEKSVKFAEPEVKVEENTDDKPKERICYRCMTINSGDSEECERCGAPLDVADFDRNAMNPGYEALKQLFSVDPANKISGIPVREMMTFVKTNLLYYIPLFKQMAERGRRVSCNLLCFIFPQVYFANRRMWFWAILTSIISLVLAMPLCVSYLVNMGLQYPEQAFFSRAVNDALASNAELLNNLTDACNVLDMGVRILLCLFGNYIYYRHVVRELRRIRINNGGSFPDDSVIRSQGGVRIFNTIIILAISFLLTAFSLTFMKTFMEGLFLS